MMKKKIYVSFKVIFLTKIGNFGVVALQPHKLFQIFRNKFFLALLDKVNRGYSEQIQGFLKLA